MTRRRATSLPAIAAVLSGTPAARAHLVTTDLGPFYDGALHPAVSPLDLLPILAIAAVAGLGGPDHGRRALLALSAGWLSSSFATFASRTGALDAPLIAPAAILMLGITAAANLRPASVALAAAAGLLGLWRGALSGADAAASGDPWTLVAGVNTGVFTLAAATLAASVWLSQRKARIVVRVAGSWIAAIGLLLIGWHFRAAPL